MTRGNSGSEAGGDALAAVRNLAAKALRRASAVPKMGIRAARRARRLLDHADRFRAEWRVEQELADVARGREPIVVGPWLSEVGFEVLYWIPFLRWFEDRYRVDADRVIAVSRGGVAEWYSGVAGRYVEIFDHLDPAEFGRRNTERRTAGEGGGQKQTRVSALDDELIATATRQCGVARAAVCHPSFMYRLFGQFWLGNRALDVVTSHTRHLRASVTPRPFGLPARYVAAKFYTGAAIPDSVEHRRALRELVARIAEHTPVVMLDTGMTTDEHEDYLFRDVPNVITMREQLTPATNLGVQTAVIAGAQGFVGTCGSLAWLAPMLGVDTVAVYADDRLLVSHLCLATHVYRQAHAARFESLDLGAAMHFELASPGQVP